MQKPITGRRLSSLTAQGRHRRGQALATLTILGNSNPLIGSSHQALFGGGTQDQNSKLVQSTSARVGHRSFRMPGFRHPDSPMYISGQHHILTPPPPNLPELNVGYILQRDKSSSIINYQWQASIRELVTAEAPICHAPRIDKHLICLSHPGIFIGLFRPIVLGLYLHETMFVQRHLVMCVHIPLGRR